MAKTALERFEEKYEPVPESGCWVWTASLSRGYGQLSVGSRTDGSRRLVKAHRWAYEYFVGPVPDGLVVCHTCDVRSCVNPAHLFLGTQAENLADMVRKNRSTRGERNSQAKLTEAEVREIRRAQGPQCAIARCFGVSQRVVGRIRRGERWSHVA